MHAVLKLLKLMIKLYTLLDDGIKFLCFPFFEYDSVKQEKEYP